MNFKHVKGTFSPTSV